MVRSEIPSSQHIIGKIIKVIPEMDKMAKNYNYKNTNRYSTMIVFSLLVVSASAFSGISGNLKTFTRTQAAYPNPIVLRAESIGMATGTGPSLPSGMLKQVKKEGNGPSIRVGDVATVRFSCEVIDESHGSTSIGPFAKSPGQKFVVGDGLMIDGWEIALQSMRGGERSIVRLSDPKLAYGSAGVPPIVPVDAIVEMDMEVLEVEAGVDLGTIASADPLKPRTPASIAAAYNTRRENAALEEADQKEGLEGLIAKFKTFYFFGFFEGETGQQAPWYLRPSITFPIAFAVVGAAFWVAYAGGGITERGAQVKDELDEYIVSMNGDPSLINQAFVMAFLVSLGIGN